MSQIRYVDGGRHKTVEDVAAMPSSGGAVLVAVAWELRVGVNVVEPNVVGLAVVPGICAGTN